IMRKLQWGRAWCAPAVARKQPLPGLILSTTARAGVLGFAKALADEVAPDGITVNVVCPGFIATERITELTETRAKRERRAAQEVMRDMVATIPLGRMGRADELAAAVAFLASELASYITGAVLQVDGGFTRSISNASRISHPASRVSMKAIVKEQRVPGLKVATVPKPSPGPGEVLIAVRHAGVCGTDVHIADWDAWAQ